MSRLPRARRESQTHRVAGTGDGLHRLDDGAA
jgi:hypothetical protein